MRLDSPIPRSMLRDPITGPKVHIQEQAIQDFMQDDAARAAEFIEELAETRGLHAEIITRGWSGLPIDAVVLPIKTRDERIANRKQGVAAQLKLTYDVCWLPGFSSGHMSRVEALHSAQTRYDAHEAAQKAAQETAVPLPK